MGCSVFSFFVCGSDVDQHVFIKRYIHTQSNVKQNQILSLWGKRSSKRKYLIYLFNVEQFFFDLIDFRDKFIDVFDQIFHAKHVWILYLFLCAFVVTVPLFSTIKTFEKFLPIIFVVSSIIAPVVIYLIFVFSEPSKGNKFLSWLQEINYDFRIILPVEEQVIGVIYSLWLFFMPSSVLILRVVISVPICT